MSERDVLCDFCKERFPAIFHLPFSVNGTSYTADPECARKEVGRVHGIKNYKYHGPIARATWKVYLKWKRKGLKSRTV